MIIIEGFQPAKLALTRQPLVDFSAVSPVVKDRISEIFGADINLGLTSAL